MAITNNLGITLVDAGQNQKEVTINQALQTIDLVLGTNSATVRTLTDAATITTDAATGSHFRVTLGGNRTLANPTNPRNGQRATWEFIQDATGSRTITLGAAFAFGTDVTGVTLTTTASKRDFMDAIYNSTTSKWYVVKFTKGY
jgi:hypothetical protein